MPLAAFVGDALKPFDTVVKEKGLALRVVYDGEVRTCAIRFPGREARGT